MDLGPHYSAAAAAQTKEDGEGDVCGCVMPGLKLSPSVLLKLDIQSIRIRNAAELVASSLEMRLSGHDNGIAPSGKAQADKLLESQVRAPTCPECGKSFLSDKALYGHLRCHPEKGYKGASRPAAAAEAAAAAADAVVGGKMRKVRRKTVALSPSWTVTGKRGRVPLGANAGSAAMTAPLTSTEEEAVRTLMELSTGHQTAGAKQPMKLEHATGIVTGHQTTEYKQPVQLEHVTDIVSRHRRTNDKQQVQLGHVQDVVGGTDDKNGSLEEHVLPDTKASGAKQRSKRGLHGLSPPPPSPSPPGPTEGCNPPVTRIQSPASARKHECATCHKTFPTHQALGGHMTSHNKGKNRTQHDDLAKAQAMNNILAHHRHDNNVFDCAGKPPRDSPPVPKGPSKFDHVCSECNMSFPTGQALGGHMRRHRTGRAETPRPKLTVPAPVPMSPTRRPFDFDLNELAKSEEN